MFLLLVRDCARYHLLPPPQELQKRRSLLWELFITAGCQRDIYLFVFVFY
jgi:hypothetical protein